MAKYLLTMDYEGGDTPMGDWDPADVRAHIDFQTGLDRELAAAGELIESVGLAQMLTRVVSDGDTMAGEVRPADGRLCGYRLVDVESEERVVAIAARCSAAPGAGGRPSRQPIEVRRVMSAP